MPSNEARRNLLSNERLDTFWDGLWLELWPFLYFRCKMLYTSFYVIICYYMLLHIIYVIECYYMLLYVTIRYYVLLYVIVCNYRLLYVVMCYHMVLHVIICY